MLEGLARIDWSKLTHAYGEASDVPGVLRQLASDDVEERKAAMSTLQMGIWHQGTVYEATAESVPFLIELLSEPAVEGKADLLILLSLCANGNSYCDVHQGLLPNEEKETEEWKAQLEKELGCVTRTRAAVIAGRKVYLRMLIHEEAAVREAAGFLLATLDRPSRETASALWQQFEHETDDRCRASLLIGFGRVADSEAANQSLLLNVFLQSKTKAERLAAALALAEVSPNEVAHDVVKEIIAALYDPVVVQLMDASPWGVHGMELIIDGALLDMKGEVAVLAIRELEKTLADAEHPAAMNAARALLTLAFREPLSKEATMESLTDLQQRVIRLMAVNKHAWVKSVAGAPAVAPKDAVVFRFRATDFVLERLCAEAAYAAGTFPRIPKSFWERLRRRISNL